MRDEGRQMNKRVGEEKMVVGEREEDEENGGSGPKIRN